MATDSENISSSTIEVEIIGLESHINTLKQDYNRYKTAYNKIGSTSDKIQMEDAFRKLTEQKYKLKTLKNEYKKQKLREDKEKETYIENMRKATIFDLLDSIIEEYHVYAIPEFYNKNKLWDNIFWWEKDEWVNVKKSDTLMQTLLTRMKLNQYIIDKNDTSEFIHRVQTYHMKRLDEWNKYQLFNNGLLDNGMLVANDYRYFTYKRYTFELLDKDELSKRLDLNFLIYQFSKVTKEWEEICWWVGNCLRQMPMEYFLIFLGRPSGGKSPWAKLIRNLFDEVGTDSFDGLGVNGGFATSWDKQINIDFDANMAYLVSETIAKIKQIYGDDPLQNVKLLHQNSFQTKLSPYMLVLINTMPKIPQGVDCRALFKRARICEFNEQLDDDPTFKQIIEERDFINLFGSFCYWKSFESKLLNGNLCNRRTNRLEEFINQTEKLWMDSAYPVRNAVYYLLKRSINPDDEINARVISSVVQVWFNDYKYNKLGLSLPTNLVSDITESIGLLGGDKCSRDGKKAYEGVYWTNEGKELYNLYLKKESERAESELSETEIKKNLKKIILEEIKDRKEPFSFEEIINKMKEKTKFCQYLEPIMEQMFSEGIISKNREHKYQMVQAISIYDRNKYLDLDFELVIDKK